MISVLRQLEARERSLPDEQLGAAFAYLEVIWIEALRHAQETDGALVQLELARGRRRCRAGARARRYHASVRNLRQAVAGRVQRLLAAAPDVSAPAISDRTRSTRPARPQLAGPAEPVELPLVSEGLEPIRQGLQRELLGDVQR